MGGSLLHDLGLPIFSGPPFDKGLLPFQLDLPFLKLGLLMLGGLLLDKVGLPSLSGSPFEKGLLPFQVGLPFLEFGLLLLLDGLLLHKIRLLILNGILRFAVTRDHLL